MDNNIRLDSPEEKAEALIKLALCGYLFPSETIELIRTKYKEFATETTNKEWMSTLPAEQFYDKMMWLIKDYGMRFNNTRLAVIAWLDEPHEVEPMQNKTSNALDALDCVEERKKGEWDMFDLISSAYYGKGMYFKQDNGTVYSRHSGEYMTVDEAIREFISLIDEDVICVPSVTTVWADGEAPTYVLQKRGKWEERIVEDSKYDPYGFFKKRWYCSACGKWQTHGATKYCPHCGAKMESEEEDG